MHADSTSRLTLIETDKVPVPHYDTTGTVQGLNLQSADIQHAAILHCKLKI